MIGALVGQLHNQYLPLGDFTGFVIAIYTQYLGDVGLGMIFFTITAALYVRYQNFSLISVIWILIGGLLQAAIPTPSINVGTLFWLLGVTGILYKIFTSRGSTSG